MIELEIMVVLLVSIFFTLLYVVEEALVWGIITFGCWFTLSLMWLFINPMSTSYVVALFFNIIGWIFLLMVIVQLYRQLQVEKWGESDLEG